MHEHLKPWLEMASNRRAVTAVEYGLIAAPIAAVIITALTTLGGNRSNMFTSPASSVH